MTNTNLPRMRTIPKAYAELKKMDSNTSFSIKALRDICARGEIPILKVGNKTLINLDLLIAYLYNANNDPTAFNH